MDGGFLDYSIWKCNWDKLNDLSHLVRAPWIRPEDIQEYEAIGIDMFKISGREFPTSRLKRALEAYASRKYEGNLLDLQSCILFSLDAPLGEMDVKTRQTRLMGLASHMPMVSSKLENLPQLDIRLDNTALDGFIDFFKEGKCTSLCHKCGYCQSWTEKALTYDPQSVEFYRDALGKLIKNLTTSNFLKYSKYITIAQKLIRV
jgi:hypothetical protein